MAHHSLRRAAGTWIGVVTPQDFEFLDLMQFRSIDGDTGGTWNPSAWIILGGNYGLRIGATAALQVDGNGSILGDCTIGSSESNELSVNSNTRFEHNAEALGDFIAGGDFYNTRNCDFCSNSADTFRVRGTATFNENVTFDKTATFNGNAVFGNAGTDTVTVNSAYTAVGTTALNGAVTIGPADHSTDMTVNADSTFEGATVFNGEIETNARIEMYSTVLKLNGGSYIPKRVLFTSATGPYATIGNSEALVCTAAETVFLEDVGEDGGQIIIVNARNATLPIVTAGSGHTLRTLPANTAILLVRTESSGSHGWASLGEWPYVALV